MKEFSTIENFSEPMVEPIRVTEPGLTKIVIRRDRRNNNNTVQYFLFELDCYFHSSPEENSTYVHAKRFGN